MKQMIFGVLSICLAGAAHADIPLIDAVCPGDIQVHADEGGPLFINGKEARLKTFSDSYFEGKVGGVTVSVTIKPDGPPEVSYTGKGRANGICELTEQD